MKPCAKKMLALVRTEQSASSTVISMDDAVSASIERHSVLAHAELLEAQSGRTPYTVFLRSHGCYPSSDQARTIGRLMNCAVQAADGRVYPEDVGAQARRAQRVTNRALQTEIRDRRAAARVLAAIATLSRGDVSSDFAEKLTGKAREDLAANLGAAIDLLSRISASYPHERQEGTSGIR